MPLCVTIPRTQRTVSAHTESAVPGWHTVGLADIRDEDVEMQLILLADEGPTIADNRDRALAILRSQLA